jgi:hypothetical protein
LRRSYRRFPWRLQRRTRPPAAVPSRWPGFLLEPSLPSDIA